MNIRRTRATLDRATLTEVILTEVILTGADLLRASLTGAVLTNARLSEHTPVPEGWTLATGSGRLKRAATRQWLAR